MHAKKVAVVTGSNVGIGFETAVGLAAAGYHVVLACRDVEKASRARDALDARVPGASAVVEQLDLSELASVRSFAERFRSAHDRLDVLVHNAAIVPSQRRVTADGFEMQFGVNHLGPFLLTELLLDRLERARPSRIVVVSSSVHEGAQIDFDDLNAEKKYSTMTTYGRTKLMNMLFVRALSKRIAGKGITINAVHPGVVSTELARDFPLPFRLMARLFFSTPEKGARTSLFVALDPSLDGVTGKYFASSKEKKPGAAALDDAAAERLLAISSDLVTTGSINPN
ncbi:MAG: SDR family oxidoreductase [Polyangiaceae bacterium]